MNADIFQSYIDNITQYYGVAEKELFSKGQDYSRTEPRQLFFYLCNLKGIPIVTIQSFLEKKNFLMHHSTILRGIQRMHNKIDGDEDYQQIIKKLQKISVNVH